MGWAVTDIIDEITAARKKRKPKTAAPPKPREKRARKRKEPDPTDPAVMIAAMSKEEKLAELESIRSQLESAMHQAREEIIEDASLTKEYDADALETEEPDAI